MVGATGYTGRKLLRILAGHPRVRVAFATSARESGRRLLDVYPECGCLRELTLISPDRAGTLAVDAIFLALGHGEAIQFLKTYPRLSSTRVVDLSADFRFRSTALFRKTYGLAAPAALNRKFVYGLTEVFREKIHRARHVANPGCYPTSVLLPLYPLLAGKILRLAGPISVTSASGASGAGATPKPETRFCDIDGNFGAYKPLREHRHLPEMEEVLSPFKSRLNFTPHLLPIRDGIFSDIHIPLARVPAGLEKRIQDTWRSFYRDCPFVKPVAHLPRLSEVVGTNLAKFTVRVEPRTNTVLILSVIDNLIKGAAGQAVQNLNVLFGWPEETGLAGRF